MCILGVWLQAGIGASCVVSISSKVKSGHSMIPQKFCCTRRAFRLSFRFFLAWCGLWSCCHYSIAFPGCHWKSFFARFFFHGISFQVYRCTIMDRWNGRIALVTGASVGIGYYVAESLAKAGMTVVACARSLDKLEVKCADFWHGEQAGNGNSHLSFNQSINRSIDEACFI